MCVFNIIRLNNTDACTAVPPYNHCQFKIPIFSVMMKNDYVIKWLKSITATNLETNYFPSHRILKWHCF